MTTFSFFLLAVIMLYSCTPSKSSSPESSTREAEVIKALELKAISAEFRLDTATIASVMHNNFIAVYAHKLQNKQQEIAGIYKEIVKRKSEGERMDSLYLDDFKAQLYNDNKTAVVTFYTVTKGTRKGLPYENRRMRWYDVWVKENGQWKVVAVQGTPLTGSGN